MVLFGGEASGQLLNDTWILWRESNGTTYSWRKVQAQSLPLERMQHSAVYEDQRDQFLIMGGDLNGAAAGGETDEVKGLWLGFQSDNAATDPAWQSFTASDAPGGRANQTAVFLPYPYPYKSRYPERFDPTALPGAQWARLTGAAKMMHLTYPFMLSSTRTNATCRSPSQTARKVVVSESRLPAMPMSHRQETIFSSW